MASTEDLEDGGITRSAKLKDLEENEEGSQDCVPQDVVEMETFIAAPKTTNTETTVYTCRDESSVIGRVTAFLERVSCTGPVVKVRKELDGFFKKHTVALRTLFKILLLLGYLGYFIYALVYKFGDEGSIRLLTITVVLAIGYTIHVIKKKFGSRIQSAWNNNLVKRLPDRRSLSILKIILTVFVVLYIFFYILCTVFITRPASIIPAVGLLIFMFLLFFFSKDPSQVTWRPVLWGMLLQLIFATIVLRTSWGYDAFQWLGERVTEFLAHANNGARFVFGDGFMEHFFAFQVMSVIFFFSSMISIFYFLGWMQVLIEKMALIMQYTLGTSAMESLHAAVNVFVGWGETTTLVKPLFEDMTMSELHTIMTNGFATVAGSTLAIYTLYGAPANHLISASVMSAPAALAISKLVWPEDKGRRRNNSNAIGIKREGYNIIDAASVGAISALPIVAYIIASVIAFFSILGFLNATLAWIGERVGLIQPEYPTLTFQLICSYLFWPLVFLMGVAPEDCRIVARMVGIKTFINEFLAYEDLGKVIKNGEKFLQYNGTWYKDSVENVLLTSINETLVGGVISKSSEVIATYALCGFANVTALGIMIGALTAIAPSRKEDIVKVSFRALVSGCMACFVTACIAGILGPV